MHRRETVYVNFWALRQQWSTVHMYMYIDRLKVENLVEKFVHIHGILSSLNRVALINQSNL